VADSKPFSPVTVYDSVSLFQEGMNSGSDPLLIPKNQLSFASNATVRKGFIANRPAYSKSHLNISYPSDEVQTAIEQGLFQGAGYYQPDSGNQSLFAQIGGRLFQFVVSDNDITVAEQTVSGDPNPAAATQAWMWQSENYMIVNDGQSLPVFFDGTSSRRSYGPSVLLATTDAGPYTAPAIGSPLTVTLLAPYTGPLDVPVLMHGAYYQPTATASGYEVSALNLYDGVGTIAAGTPVYIKPNIAGVVNIGQAFSGNFFAFITNTTIHLTEPCAVPVGSFVTIFGKKWYIFSSTGNDIVVIAQENGTYSNLNQGDQIQLVSSSAPNVLIGTVNSPVAIPAIGGTVNMFLSSLFSGTPGQTVYIGEKGQYKITAVPPAPPGTTLVLINLTDTDTTAGNIVSAQILSVPELPAGRMGAYGLGQNWVALTDGLSFICSDVSRGASGTQANNYRDSVLKTTDLTFAGGNFSIPGAGNVITSMTFTANLDLSLGQGSLQVGTAQFMASCLAPIDFTNPPSNGPILTFSLIGTGPLAQNSTVRVNSDVYFRSVFGIGSLIQARRDFDTPGNTPISQEMVRVLNLDNEKLLPYGSSITFDNRFLTTVSPQASSQGVLHAGLIAQNLDPVSGISGKKPPVYDGLWTGINVLQLVTGIFGGKQRAFAFTFNVTLSKIELYELLPTGSQNFDNGNVPITWTFETAAIFREDVKPRDVVASLRDGEFAVDDVVGTVRFEVFYKSDQGCWTPWHAFSICADQTGSPQYFPRLGLGEPTASDCTQVLNTSSRDFRTMQLKFIITGHCRFIRAMVMAVTVPIQKMATPICDTIETVTVQ